MPNPNVLAPDSIEVFRQKTNAHFNDATEHGGGASSGITTVATVTALEALTSAADGEHRLLSGYHAASGGGAVRLVTPLQELDTQEKAVSAMEDLLE